ncbi:CLUMA_CG011213, isoform A [Clunio marinus]|uniref:CLUMA_CG011213, isoform A n=1 Tax=Clunio marinus TaxID=568069 RepID=A0A1J1IC32_9DIPT|nr:CLUMA_CG011213, isoform A [Clunio marinus]
MNNPFNSNDRYGNQQGPVVIPPQGNVNENSPSSGAMGFQFSKEELQVLKECDIEALVQRSIPIGTTFGVATWAAIQRGFLAPSVKFGSGPKVLAAVVVGYFVGKVSYQQKCAEKVMRLPNSKLAEALRRRRKGEFFETFTQEGGLSLAPFSSSTDVYTDENLKHNQQNSLDLDVDRPANFGLDDTYRPSIDTPDRNFDDNLPLEPPKSSVTYEELRRKNREDHERRLNQPFNRQVNRNESPTVQRASQPQERDEVNRQSGVQNKYGDVWK